LLSFWESGIWLDRANSDAAPEDVERVTSLTELPALLGVGASR